MISDTLLGVIVGGLIGSLGPFLALLFQQKRWKTERRLERLLLRRAQLESLFQKASSAILSGMESGRFDTDFWSDVDFLHPESVATAISDVLHSDDKSDTAKMNGYYTIQRAMKEELAKIDREIDQIVDP